MGYRLPILPGLLLVPTFVAGDAVPKGCDFGVSATADATVSCFQDLDRNGDGSLSRQELDRLPRTRGHFDELDLDGVGGITPEEFENGINTLLQSVGGKGV